MGARKLWGDGGGGTCDGLSFHPGGAATTSSHFVLQRPG